MTVPANESPLPQLDVFQHPAGLTMNKQLFDQIGTGPWRVRARYSGQAAAPWSAWSSFKVQ
jgi:hypothetical protein